MGRYRYGVEHYNDAEDEDGIDDTSNELSIIQSHPPSEERSITVDRREDDLQRLHPSFYDQSEEPTTTSKLSYTRHVVVVIATVLIFGRYLPSPPPPHYNWAQCMGESFVSITSNLHTISLLLAHVFTGTLVNLKHDLYSQAKSAYAIFHTDKNESKKRCYMTLPLGKDTLFATEEYLSSHIIGQDNAIRSVVRAIESWDSIAPDASSNMQSNDSNPLLMVFVGGSGVGKSFTARHIAHLLFQHCANEADEVPMNNYMNERVLELDASEFRPIMGQDTNDTIDHSIINMIIEHVYNQRGEGAVVILKHFEDMSAQTLTELQEHILGINGEKLFVPIHDNDLYGRYSAKDLEISMGNVLFILTSDIGTDIIYKQLKEDDSLSQGSAQAYKKLQGNVKRSIDEVMKVDMVVPFMPLGYNDLDELITEKISSINKANELEGVWKELIVSKEAQDVAVASIQYIQHNSFISAVYGAYELEKGDLIQAIKTVVKSKYFNAADTVVIDYDDINKEIFVVRCDEGSRFATTKEITMCQEVWRKDIQ